MTETITIKELQVSWHLTNLDMVPMVNHSVIQKTFNKQLSGFILDAGDTIMEQGQKVPALTKLMVSGYVKNCSSLLTDSLTQHNKGILAQRYSTIREL